VLLLKLISNKGYNIQLPKHKTLKILDIQLFSGDLNNILLGNSGYDSNNIRNKLKNIKFGKL
jgi:hypothetical protein